MIKQIRRTCIRCDRDDAIAKGAVDWTIRPGARMSLILVAGLIALLVSPASGQSEGTPRVRAGDRDLDSRLGRYATRMRPSPAPSTERRCRPKTMKISSRAPANPVSRNR